MAAHGESVWIGGAHTVRVYGSVARGEADETSDLDLLVAFDPDKRGVAFIGLLDDLERDLVKLLGVRVEIATGMQPHAESSAAIDAVLL